MGIGEDQAAAQELPVDEALARARANLDWAEDAADHLLKRLARVLQPSKDDSSGASPGTLSSCPLEGDIREIGGRLSRLAQMLDEATSRLAI